MAVHSLDHIDQVLTQALHYLELNNLTTAQQLFETAKALLSQLPDDPLKTSLLIKLAFRQGLLQTAFKEFTAAKTAFTHCVKLPRQGEGDALTEARAHLQLSLLFAEELNYQLAVKHAVKGTSVLTTECGGSAEFMELLNALAAQTTRSYAAQQKTTQMISQPVHRRLRTYLAPPPRHLGQKLLSVTPKVSPARRLLQDQISELQSKWRKQSKSPVLKGAVYLPRLPDNDR